MRILIYLIAIIAAYYLIILRMIVRSQINKYKDKSSSASQKKYDPGKIEDADYEEMK
jgi:hypothetical protein